jgi:hypothetical protein
MKKCFDIVWFGDNGPTWIEAVETLETAKARIENCLRAVPEVILSLITELVLAYRLHKNSRPVEPGLGTVCLPDVFMRLSSTTAADNLAPRVPPAHTRAPFAAPLDPHAASQSPACPSASPLNQIHQAR